MVNVPNLETIRALLKDMKLNAVAESAGVNYVTLTRFASGQTQDPGYEFVAKVARYLGERIVTISGE